MQATHSLFNSFPKILGKTSKAKLQQTEFKGNLIIIRFLEQGIFF